MFGGYISIHSSYPMQENSATPNHTVGTKAVTPDGRIFRYAKAGATALIRGRLNVAADITANHEDNVFQTAGAVGDTTVSITVGATAVTANEYVGGYLCIQDDTGEGYNHLIVRHDAKAAAAGTVTFDIKPGLFAATTVATTVTLVRNPWSNVVISDGTQTDIPVGVSVCAVTANYYCWLQTGGIASVLTDTAGATAGTQITIGTTDAGAVETRNAVAEPIVGIEPAGGVSTAAEHNPFFLTIDT